MFLYGLYTIESHHQHKQPPPLNHYNRKASGHLEVVKNFTGRQKSYSISDSCHLKALQVAKNRSKNPSGSGTPPNPTWPMQQIERRLKQTSICESVNMTKYELNLCKFEYYLEKLRKQEEQSRLESFLSNKTCLPVEKRRNTVHSSNAGNKISTSTRPTVVKSSSPTSSTSSACSSSSSSTTIEKRLQTPRLSTDTQHFHFRPTNTNAPRKATFPRIEAFRNSQQEKSFRSFDAGEENGKRVRKTSTPKKWLASLMGKLKGNHSNAV